MSFKKVNEVEKNKIEIIYTGLDKQYEKFVDSLKKQANENNISIKIKYRRQS